MNASISTSVSTELNFGVLNRNPLHIEADYKKGNAVYKQETYNNKIYRVKSGLVLLGSTNDSGDQVFNQFVGEGEFFGLEGLERIKTKSFAEVLSNEAVIEEYSIQSIDANHPLMSEINKWIFQQYGRLQQTLTSIVKLTLEERVKWVFKSITELTGNRLINGEHLIRTKIKHRELAFICQASRQSVTTVLNKLVDAGYLQIDRNSILIREKLINNQ